MILALFVGGNLLEGAVGMWRDEVVGVGDVGVLE